jgi:hypothetical protein
MFTFEQISSNVGIIARAGTTHCEWGSRSLSRWNSFIDSDGYDSGKYSWPQEVTQKRWYSHTEIGGVLPLNLVVGSEASVGCTQTFGPEHREPSFAHGRGLT